MKTKRQKGFTLVELMVGMAAGAIVLLATGTAVVTNQIFWNKAWEKTNLQRDASYAMLRMSRSIKAGRSATVESDGKSITIYRDTDWIKYFLWPETKDLKCQIEGGEAQTVVNGKVEDLVFAVEANRVGIHLKLKKDDLENHFVSTVTIRNYGE